jgi:hypothetical protein
MRNLPSWSRTASFVMTAFLAAVPYGLASAQKRPSTGSEGDVPELQPPTKKKPRPKIVYKGYCCESWKTVKNEEGKETQQGHNCTQTEDGNRCTNGRELGDGKPGSWKDCGGATMEPERTPSGQLNKDRAMVRDCTPK